MKKTFKHLCIATLAAVIGFSMTACDNSTSSGGGGTNTAYITI